MSYELCTLFFLSKSLNLPDPLPQGLLHTLAINIQYHAAHSGRQGEVQTGCPVWEIIPETQMKTITAPLTHTMKSKPHTYYGFHISHFWFLLQHQSCYIKVTSHSSKMQHTPHVLDSTESGCSFMCVCMSKALTMGFE